MIELCRIIDVQIEDKQINTIYDKSQIRAPISLPQVPINTYMILRSSINPQKTALARLQDRNTIVLVNTKHGHKLCSVKPKDAKQTTLIDSFVNEDILISCAIGPAGTGKTYLAMAYAMDKYLSENKCVYMTKPTTLIGRGKAFGPVPGDIKEKYSPHIASYKIVLKKLLGETSANYIDLLEEKKAIEYVPLEYVRGCTFENCTFILDEVQNLNWHELKSLASRMGENTKLILLGDPEQIDTRQNVADSGIASMLYSKSYQDSKLTSCIYLEQQYRGPIPQIITSIDRELNLK